MEEPARCEQRRTMPLIEPPEIGIVIVAGLSRMGLALFEQNGTVGCQRCVDCRQPLLRVPISAPCKENFVQPVNQAIRPLLYDVAYSAPVEDLTVWGRDSYHLEQLSLVAQIAILQKTKWENVAERTALLAANLARYKPDPNVPNVLPIQSATAILAIGRWATTNALDPWNRHASFVNPHLQDGGRPTLSRG